MRCLLLLPLVALSVISYATSADTLGVRAGANYWKYDISGTARYQTKNSANDIDLNQDLGYDNGSAGVYYLVLEHPVPLLPNVRLSYTDIDENADGRLSKTVVYGNTTFLANEAVSSQVELKQTDITLYYELLDNVVSLDLGLAGKYIDSKARITGEISGTQDASVSGWVPLVYLGAGADLPLTGLGVSADGSFAKYQDSTFYDYSIRATYTTPWMLGLDVGYRKIKLDLDDFDNSFANVEFDGPYAGAYLHF
jgi:outer membrane protein